MLLTRERLSGDGCIRALPAADSFPFTLSLSFFLPIARNSQREKIAIISVNEKRERKKALESQFRVLTRGKWSARARREISRRREWKITTSEKEFGSVNDIYRARAYRAGYSSRCGLEHRKISRGSRNIALIRRCEHRERYSTLIRGIAERYRSEEEDARGIARRTIADGDNERARARALYQHRVRLSGDLRSRSGIALNPNGERDDARARADAESPARVILCKLD